MDLVLPGVELVLATFNGENIELINEDFPTFDRPHNTTVANSLLGISDKL